MAPDDGKETVADEPVTLKSVFEDFCENTTAHGFSKLGKQDDDSFKFRRHLWSFLIFSAFVGFSVHLGIMVSRYLTYPVNTVIIESSVKFRFPDVTFCLNPPFSTYRMWNLNNTYPHSDNVALSDMTLTLLKFWASVINPSDSIGWETARLSRLSLGQAMADINAYPEAYELFISCTYRGKYCSYKNFTTIWHPEYFRCFTFKPDHREIEAEGNEGGLQLVVLRHRWYYFASNLEQAGLGGAVVATVHPEGTTPNFRSNKAIVPPGKSLDIKLSMTKSEKLNRKGNPCKMEDTESVYFIPSMLSKNLSMTFKSSEVDCKNTEVQNLFLDKCNCLSEAYKIPYEMRNNPSCHAVPSKYWEYGLRGWRWPSHYGRDKYYALVNDSWILEDVNETAIAGEHYCEQNMKLERMSKTLDVSDKCLQHCHSTSYKIQTEQQDWPFVSALASGYIYNLVADKVNKLRLENVSDEENMLTKYASFTGDVKTVVLKIDIYADNPNGVLMQEELAYLLTNLLSDMMGILGFWAGISILTVCEIIEIFLKLFRNKKKSNEQIEPETSVNDDAEKQVKEEKAEETV